MKIATWNVFNGTSEQRSRKLSDTDIIAFQETDKTENSMSCVWTGDEGKRFKGVSVWSSRHRFSCLPHKPHCSPGLAAVFNDTPLGAIQILNLWAKPKPDYCEDLINSLKSYREFILRAPTIVLGDFNISPKLSGKKRKFRNALSVLEHDFGLTSAYHHHFGDTFGEENYPTHYHHRKEEKPFHIDFVFLPDALLARLNTVTVPDYSSYSTSDHRPVICEFKKV